MKVSNKKYYKKVFLSPIGFIEITGTENSITEVNFIEEIEDGLITNNYVDNCANQLREYFEGSRRTFELILEPEGTDFQKSVWQQLRKIPYGTTISYGTQSKLLGSPLSIRAVAKANAQNKIAIIIPCHRVVGADGSLTGYVGGLWRKKWLLDHEQKYFDGEKQLEIF